MEKDLSLEVKELVLENEEAEEEMVLEVVHVKEEMEEVGDGGEGEILFEE